MYNQRQNNYIQCKNKNNKITLQNWYSLLPLQFDSKIKLTWMALSQTGLLLQNAACSHHIGIYCANSISTCLQVHLMHLLLYL